MSNVIAESRAVESNNVAMGFHIDFALEYYDQVIDAIKPLLEAHYQEIAHFKDIPLAPKWEAYRTAEKLNKLRIYTARYRGELIGYAIYLLPDHPHYSTTTWAIQDILYVTPAFRKGRLGRELIIFSENLLRLIGVDVIQQHVKVKPEHDFSPLLKRMGYECMDTIWVKRL